MPRSQAAQPNVAVKLSGMVTEADRATWSPGDLRPFVSQVAEWFGVRAARVRF